MKNNIKNVKYNNTQNELCKIMNSSVVIKPYKTDVKEALLKIKNILRIQDLSIIRARNLLQQNTPPLVLSDDNPEVYYKHKLLRRLNDIRVNYEEIQNVLMYLIEKFDETYYDALKEINKYCITENQKQEKK